MDSPRQDTRSHEVHRDPEAPQAPDPDPAAVVAESDAETEDEVVEAEVGVETAVPDRSTVWDVTISQIENTGPPGGELRRAVAEGEVGADDEGPPKRGLLDRDAETGGSGYAGDVLEQGIEVARDEPDRPADREIQGDPRTPDRPGHPGAGAPPQESGQPLAGSDQQPGKKRRRAAASSRVERKNRAGSA